MRRVKEYIDRHGLISPGDTVIVAVSGGPDSMALLHILNYLAAGMEYKIVVAHVNHLLRPEAGQEEAFVAATCRKWCIPYYTTAIDVKSEASYLKKSLEEAGRDCRYRYFYDLMSMIGANRIATAHHRDDNAETVLLHLLRGSGVKGLRGIMPLNKAVIRPLLCLNKADIYQYLHNNNIDYSTDMSNYQEAYLRNHIRHHLLPHLQNHYNPQIIDTLGQLADIVREENDVVEKACETLWPGILISDEDGLKIDKIELLQLHKAYQRRLILKALSYFHVQGWGLTDVDKILEISGKNGCKTLHLHKGLVIISNYRELIFTLGIDAVDPFSYCVPIPGKVRVEEIDTTFLFQIASRSDYVPEPDDLCLDYDTLDHDIFLRSRRPGDVISLAGMTGTKKIKKLFIDLKVPALERNRMPLLASADEVYAVLDMRLSRKVMVTPRTRTILVIKKIREDKLININT